MRLRRLLLSLGLCGVLGACANAVEPSQPLPAANDLVNAAAASFADVHSVRFRFTTSGTIPGLDIREVDGQATRVGGGHGSAQGTADVQKATERFDTEYVLIGESLYLTDSTGRTTTAPVPAQYTPARLLDPNTGIRTLLTKAAGTRTERTEGLDEVPTYRISGKVDGATVSGIVPTIQSTVDIKFWVGQTERRDLLRVWIQIPPQHEGASAVMLELSLTEHNMPVQVVAPA